MGVFPGIGASVVSMWAQQDWPRSWREAMHSALFGESGFYRRPEGPPGHFRTSSTASPLLAEVLADLLSEVDQLLDFPPVLDFVDLGAGKGQLLSALHARLNDDRPEDGGQGHAAPPA